MAMSTTIYPIATIAKLLMCTPRWVQHLSRDGTIPKAERGHYELVPAVQGYVKYLRDRAIGADLPDGDGDHKTRLLKARADIAEYEAERMAGELAPVEEIEKAWTDMVSRFRQRSLSVAPKAAPMVAVETATDAATKSSRRLSMKPLPNLPPPPASVPTRLMKAPLKLKISE